MITHEIQVVKPSKNTWPYTPIRQHQSSKSGVTRKLEKLEYAHFINTLSIKRGDVVINDFDRNWPNPRPPHELATCRFNYVEDIQEIHFQCEYTPGGKPRPLWLKGVDYGAGFWTSVENWAVVPYESLPKKVKDYVDARNSGQSTNTH